MKDYKAESGITLDASFSQHKSGCVYCNRVDPTKSAELALLCNEGSVLWKRENQVAVKRAPVQRDKYWATKSEVKAAMRYK